MWFSVIQRATLAVSVKREEGQGSLPPFTSLQQKLREEEPTWLTASEVSVHHGEEGMPLTVSAHPGFLCLSAPPPPPPPWLILFGNTLQDTPEANFTNLMGVPGFSQVNNQDYLSRGKGMIYPISI